MGVRRSQGTIKSCKKGKKKKKKKKKKEKLASQRQCWCELFISNSLHYPPRRVRTKVSRKQVGPPYLTLGTLPTYLISRS